MVLIRNNIMIQSRTLKTKYFEQYNHYKNMHNVLTQIKNFYFHAAKRLLDRAEEISVTLKN